MAKGTTQFSVVWYRFRRNRLALIGGGIVLMVCAVAVLAPFGAPYHYTEPIDLAMGLASPSSEHWFGTDRLGRDVFSRIIYGSRIALKIGALIVVMQALMGVTLGLIAGAFGGVIDSVIMRIVDVFLAFPALVLALAIAAILGPGLYNVIIALGLVGWTSFARLVRGDVLSIKENDYIEAARAIGGSKLRIILYHLLPNVMSSIIVLTTLTFPGALLAAAALSFFGLGAQPPTPCWGSIVAGGRGYLLQAPWISTSGGIAILITVMGFNLLGDGLRDALDPKGRI
ncbi:ABC transporter permease [Dehalococcoidia bacterium]|nr:ABC transporter permease [Dehalococcoidia bacterium]